MDYAYDDILGLQRPVHTDDVFSRRHPKMARLNRAKIFAPFAALAGYDAAVRSKETPYVPRRPLDADEAWALNRTLKALRDATRTGALARRNRVEVRVEYFEPCADPNHEAFGREGLYHAITGIAWKVDPVNQTLTVRDRIIHFDDIDNLSILGGDSHDQ